MHTDAVEEFVTVIDNPEKRTTASVSDMTNACLDRIERLNPVLNAFITVSPELARTAADAADRRRESGLTVGLLDGFVMSIKDDIEVAGLPCTCGSSFMRDYVPADDAFVISKLKTAGAVIVGKNSMHEWAYGGTSNNPHFGSVRNPWNTSHIPGGSSGGSGAAIAADMAMGALGSDAGGSIRIPSAMNGVSGLRPTYGSISGRGSHAICRSLETIGPMARSARDVAAIFSVIQGFDPQDMYSVDQRMTDDPYELRVDGLRVGIPRQFMTDDTQVAIRSAVRDAGEVFAKLGAVVEDVDIETVESVYTAGWNITLCDALLIHEEQLSAHPEGYGEDVRRRLELGREVSGVNLARAWEDVRKWQYHLGSAFKESDVLILPTTRIVAPPIDTSEMITTTGVVTKNTWPWSVAAGPALSVPCGFSDGLPIGLQIVSAPWRDNLVLRAGVAYQEATDWHRRRPPI